MVENLTVKDWVTWGCQGYIVTGIYQGASKLKNAEAFLPRDLPTREPDKEHSGRILTIVVLGSVSSPCLSEDAGWFCATTPCGAPASMHRVLARWKLPYTFKPKGNYRLGSGFMLMHAQDMHVVCQMMATSILQQPDTALFNGPVPQLDQASLRAIVAAPSTIRLRRR